MCEELFGGELDVTEKTPDPFERIRTIGTIGTSVPGTGFTRGTRGSWKLKKVELALEKMDSFSRSKKNMHLPIRGGIQEAKKELEALRYDIEDTVCYLHSFE